MWRRAWFMDGKLSLTLPFFPDQLFGCFPTSAGGSSTTPSSRLGPDRASLSTAETCTSAAWIKTKMWESISAWRQTPLAPLSAGRRASTSRVSTRLLYFYQKIYWIYSKKIFTTCRTLASWHPVAHWCRCMQISSLSFTTIGQFSRCCQTFPYFWPPATNKWPSATNWFIFSYHAACRWSRSPQFLYPCPQVCFFFFYMLPLVFHKCIDCRLCLVWCWDCSQSHCW